MPDKLHIAMIGTRGVPANYGGFETAIEEIGKRLAAQGHRITVYSRGGDTSLGEYLGMQLVHLPALKGKSIETLSHTALSVGHLVAHRRPAAAFVFNAANSPFVPVLRMRRVPVAVHVDGLEWKRGKWGRGGRTYYRAAESLAVRFASALIADAPGIRDYYTSEFRVPTELIAYGAPILEDASAAGLTMLGLERLGFHLIVARFEPENHVAEIVQGYSASAATLPLVVVGSAPYAAQYTESIERVAVSDSRIRLLGGVWDQELLDQLYANALSYLHGHSVGGTNPSLLRAIGAGTSVIAFDVSFNRDILRSDGLYFDTSKGVGDRVIEAEQNPDAMVARGTRLQDYARSEYDWDDVAARYLDLAHRLASGQCLRGRRGSRTRPVSDAGVR